MVYVLAAVAVFLVTAFANWLIPLIIYAKKFGLFRQRPAGFIGCNGWGVVMDVVIAGIINVAVLGYIFFANQVIGTAEIMTALTWGFAGMVVLHVWMAVTKWEEWIMPEPWHWNAGGYYHMLSATIQFGYILLPVVLMREHPVLVLTLATKLLFMVALFGSLSFGWALRMKNKTVDWGWLRINGESW